MRRDNNGMNQQENTQASHYNQDQNQVQQIQKPRKPRKFRGMTGFGALAGGLGYLAGSAMMKKPIKVKHALGAAALGGVVGNRIGKSVNSTRRENYEDQKDDYKYNPHNGSPFISRNAYRLGGSILGGVGGYYLGNKYGLGGRRSAAIGSAAGFLLGKGAHKLDRRNRDKVR